MFNLITSELKEIKREFEELRSVYGLERKIARLKEIENELNSITTWKGEETKKLLKEKSEIEREIAEFEKIKEEIEEIEVMVEIGEEENDIEIYKECEEKFKLLKEKFSTFKLKKFMTDENDSKNAILEINAGAGGTEAQDWAEMLMRMYLRWCERKNFKTEIVDILRGEEAGIKNVTITVEGDYAYGLLKSEAGVHRLVRISPFDANKRRHTSFASVAVYPEADEEIQIEIKEDDLKIETFRASGHGGQHVNKTASAVRITHIPTGITVQCQNERSQHRNRALAMKILKARLYELELKKREKEKEKIYSQQKDIEWGNQIRSYILHPYKMIKDHRTGYETNDPQSVLDGMIDDFISAYLKWNLSFRKT
jgi:peptide chain release factor 2